MAPLDRALGLAAVARDPSLRLTTRTDGDAPVDAGAACSR